MTLLAATFHWPPSDLWELTADDLIFWAHKAKRISDRGPV
ncbi:GpE family phage tail protein [Kaustia mangrovi]|uniref:GpE family phage tail protein n=1 Tax=Kaustia mangrovi TaxID=2593653 RepID=A0A7S8C8N9_9HYPH|nr:GpE family phage tail protein [Kaustia mangrovi]